MVYLKIARQCFWSIVKLSARVWIFQERRVRFHIVGLKCKECSSYNTSREGEEGVPVAAAPLPMAAQAPQDDEERETED